MFQGLRKLLIILHVNSSALFKGSLNLISTIAIKRHKPNFGSRKLTPSSSRGTSKGVLKILPNPEKLCSISLNLPCFKLLTATKCRQYEHFVESTYHISSACKMSFIASATHKTRRPANRIDFSDGQRNILFLCTTHRTFRNNWDHIPVLTFPIHKVTNLIEWCVSIGQNNSLLKSLLITRGSR